MNTYTIGDKVTLPLEFIYNKADFPIAAYNVLVRLLNPDRTVAVGVTEVALSPQGTANGIAVFPAVETATLTDGIYYVRARLVNKTDATDIQTWKLAQVNFIKVA